MIDPKQIEELVDYIVVRNEASGVTDISRESLIDYYSNPENIDDYNLIYSVMMGDE